MSGARTAAPPAVRTPRNNEAIGYDPRDDAESWARQSANPTSRSRSTVGRLLATLPDPPKNAQWATFLRNHDEVDLGQLTSDERADVFAAFGPEADMQIYDRGIRRRPG